MSSVIIFVLFAKYYWRIRRTEHAARIGGMRSACEILAWMKAGVWKLRGIKRGWEKGTCPLYRDNEDAKHILLSCPETKQEVLQITKSA
jgi:hypothetical protein